MTNQSYLEVTEEVFEDLVELLKSVGEYSLSTALVLVQKAIDGNEYSIELIERTILLCNV